MDPRYAHLLELDDDELDALAKQTGDVAQRHIAEIKTARERGVRPKLNGVAAEKPAPSPRKSVTVVIPWQKLATKNLLRRKDRESQVAYSAAIKATREAAKRQLRPKVSSPLPLWRLERVAISITLYPPNEQWDPHNVIDGLLDGLEGAIYRNDRQIRQGHWNPQDPDKEHPRVHVTVTVLDD